MKKTKMDDNFHSYLVENARLVGDAGIPCIMNLCNTQIPKGIISFKRAKSKKLLASEKRLYVHFYMHDKDFSDLLTSTNRYLSLLKQFDGVISPDCTLLIGQSRCLQQTNTYFNRAIGFYLQKNGIPVTPNVRWSDESSFDFCFLGIPQRSIVSISTHGCMLLKGQHKMFKRGLKEMLKQLVPTDVLVHGYMPGEVFADFLADTRFHRFPSEFELTHRGEDE